MGFEWKRGKYLVKSQQHFSTLTINKLVYIGEFKESKSIKTDQFVVQCPICVPIGDLTYYKGSTELKLFGVQTLTMPFFSLGSTIVYTNKLY